MQSTIQEMIQLDLKKLRRLIILFMFVLIVTLVLIRCVENNASNQFKSVVTIKDNEHLAMLKENSAQKNVTYKVRLIGNLVAKETNFKATKTTNVDVHGNRWMGYEDWGVYNKNDLSDTKEIEVSGLCSEFKTEVFKEFSYIERLTQQKNGLNFVDRIHSNYYVIEDKFPELQISRNSVEKTIPRSLKVEEKYFNPPAYIASDSNTLLIEEKDSPIRYFYNVIPNQFEGVVLGQIDQGTLEPLNAEEYMVYYQNEYRNDWEKDAKFHYQTIIIIIFLVTAFSSIFLICILKSKK